MSVACFVSCGGHSTQPAVDADLEPTWWQPKVGEAKNWDIQLGAPIDVSEPRTMYDLDLWALVPSPTTIDHDNDSTGDPQFSGAVCPQQTVAMIADGIYKDVALTTTVRTQCAP